MKNLENYGVQELNAREMEGIDGGGWIADLVHWLKCNGMEHTPGYIHSQYGI